MNSIILTKVAGVDRAGNKLCRVYDTEIGQFYDVKLPPLYVQALIDAKRHVSLSGADEKLVLKSGKIFSTASALFDAVQTLKREQYFRFADYEVIRAMRGAGGKNTQAFCNAVLAKEEISNQERYDDSLDVIISFRSYL